MTMDREGDGMEERALTRSIPGWIGLLGVLTVLALAVLSVWSFVDSYLIESSDYLAPTLGALAVVVLVIGALSLLGARSRRWLAGPYW